MEIQVFPEGCVSSEAFSGNCCVVLFWHAEVQVTVLLASQDHLETLIFHTFIEYHCCFDALQHLAMSPKLLLLAANDWWHSPVIHWRLQCLAHSQACRDLQPYLGWWQCTFWWLVWHLHVSYVASMSPRVFPSVCAVCSPVHWPERVIPSNPISLSGHNFWFEPSVFLDCSLRNSIYNCTCSLNKYVLSIFRVMLNVSAHKGKHENILFALVKLYSLARWWWHSHVAFLMIPEQGGCVLTQSLWSSLQALPGILLWAYPNLLPQQGQGTSLKNPSLATLVKITTAQHIPHDFFATYPDCFCSNSHMTPSKVYMLWAYFRPCW